MGEEGGGHEEGVHEERLVVGFDGCVGEDEGGGERRGR